MNPLRDSYMIPVDTTTDKHVENARRGNQLQYEIDQAAPFSSVATKLLELIELYNYHSGILVNVGCNEDKVEIYRTYLTDLRKQINGMVKS